MTSIKRSLNLRQALIQILVFGIFSVGIYRFVENRLKTEFDRSLETLAKAGTGTVEVEWKKKKKVFEFEIENDHAPAYDRESTIFLLQDHEGNIQFNPNEVDLEKWTPPRISDAEVELGEFTMPDGRLGRYRTQRFVPKVDDGDQTDYGKQWSITVVRERHSIDDTLEKILFGCLGLGTLATFLTLGANYLSVRRGLKPLDQIGEEVTGLKASSLDHRFATEDLPKELKPIVSRLNEMLERMKEGFEREQRFTSNAAHELRTPLAELQAILQVGKKWRPEDLENDDPVNYFADGSEVTNRMSRLLETLFTLSQEPPESLEKERSEFCLVSSLKSLVSSHAEASRIQIEPVSSIIVFTDKELLFASLSNLIENAVSHSEGEIELEFSETKTSASVLVKNPAPDLTQEDMKHLREPFWRKESARSNQDHLGLGLNLVENFCRSQHWTLDFNLTEDGQFCVEISNIPKPPKDLLPPQKTATPEKNQPQSLTDFTEEPAT